jgi:hypothetical protein
MPTCVGQRVFAGDNSGQERTTIRPVAARVGVDDAWMDMRYHHRSRAGLGTVAVTVRPQVPGLRSAPAKTAGASACAQLHQPLGGSPARGVPPNGQVNKSQSVIPNEFVMTPWGTPLPSARFPLAVLGVPGWNVGDPE